MRLNTSILALSLAAALPGCNEADKSQQTNPVGWFLDHRDDLAVAIKVCRDNPGELGNNWKSRLLKDYNGQTYWLSFNIRSFLGTVSSFPRWANIAVGYGGEGMTGANENPREKNGISIPEFKRYRQFYLAPDADLYRIESKQPVVNNISYLLRFIKMPAPTLELSQQKLKFHPIYF